MLGVVLCAFVSIAISKSSEATIWNSGKITLVGLDAYGGDITSNNRDFSVGLGTIPLGSSKSVSFFLRSLSNVPTTLTFSIDNWQPRSLERFMLVTWNYSEKLIAPNEEIPIRIDFYAPESADFSNYLFVNSISSFSFSLYIYASES